MSQFTEPILRDALRAVCAEHDLPHRGARLLHHYSNAVFVLPAVNVVVRFTTSKRIGQTIAASQSMVSRLIHENGLPATEPIERLTPVRLSSGLTASFWRYYRQPEPGQQFAATDLAELIRQLHVVRGLDEGLPRWEALSSLRGELSREEPLHGLSHAEAEWLRDTASDIAQNVSSQAWPLGVGLIHGDAWVGNLLWNGREPTLGDWDNVSVGPREVDLIPTWHAAVRYGRDWVPEFVDVYGHDLADNPTFDLLLRMRDLAQLTGPLKRAAESPQHHAVLRQRLDAIRSGDRTQRWLAL